MRYLITLIVMSVMSMGAIASSGATDKYGCHSGSKPYHCHGGITVNLSVELHILDMYKSTLTKKLVGIAIGLIKNEFKDKDLTDALILLRKAIESGENYLDAVKRIIKDKEIVWN